MTIVAIPVDLEVPTAEPPSGCEDDLMWRTAYTMFATDDVEASYAWWKDAGRPDYTRFGLTVRGETHRIWLDEPEQFIAER